MTLIDSTPHAPVAPSTGTHRPLGVDEVVLRGGFWGERQEVNGRATLDHIEHWLEREGWLGNFDLAASGRLPEGRRGREFADSEIYKYLEAVAWELARRDDPGLEARFRAVVARVAAAQEPDGYVGTAFGREGQAPRWSDLEWGHELYCLGHLFQAAVARVRTRPDADDGLADIARRAADLVCEVFGDGGIESVCGHPEIETGLAELGRALGEPRYIEQAKRFVDRRGHGVLRDIEWGRSYYQDDVPVRDADVLRGHAVRANYLASGAADVAVETDDAGLLDALARQWRTTMERRTYVTGGQGSHHQDEAFGEDWELPSDRAYSETCAGVASVQFSWRLLLARGGAEYADQIERTLYNVVATSPSREGTSFYYANTLHQRRPGALADPDEISPRAHSSLRAPWFEVSCCPPNVARTLASLAGYVATAHADGLHVHQYAPGSIRTHLDDGRAVALEVDTDYPRSGSIRMRVTESTGTWTLALRIPSWADGAHVTIRSTSGAEERVDVEPGVAQLRREFAEGDEVVLELPMAPRFTRPDPRVDAVRGCVVVERGPEVFALESVDLDGTALADADFADLRVDDSLPARDMDGGVVVSLRDGRSGVSADVALVRYHEWAERGPSQMRVWIPVVGA